MRFLLKMLLRKLGLFMVVKYFVLMLFVLALPGSAIRRLPPPKIVLSQLQASPAQELLLQGSGFLNNRPAEHRVYIWADHLEAKRRLSVIAANSDVLTVLLPKKLAYGSYHLAVRLQSKYLRSKTVVYHDLLEVLPAAPRVELTGFRVLSNQSELYSILANDSFHGYKLFANDNLGLGLNHLKFFYWKDGLRSLDSQPVMVYYLPRELMNSELELQGSHVSVVTKNGTQKFDLTDFVELDINGLERHYYIKTPSNGRYLETIIRLSPVYISVITITGDESVTLTNRSTEVFPLANCYLKDDLRSRYVFATGDLINPSQSLTVNQNLGLNDTGPDSMSLVCNNSLVDKYSY